MLDFYDVQEIALVQESTGFFYEELGDAFTEKASLLHHVISCPVLSNKNINHLKIDKLGGWSNTSFKLDFSDEAFVMRLNRKNSFLNINREFEKKNSLLAESLGVGARILYCEPDFQVTKYIKNKGMISAEDFNNEEILSNVISTLKKLHFSGLKFCNALNPYERLVSVYKKICQEGSMLLPKELDEAIQKFKPIFSSQKMKNLLKVPCHNDTTPYNMLHTERGTQLVDWEHSANNDPAWDLAYLSAEARFSTELDDRMLCLYEPEDADFSHRFSIYKPLIHLWSTVWLYTQIYSGNEVLSVEEFRKIAGERLSLCLELFKEDAFKKAVRSFEEEV
jgi:thiamine kinase-like enzyme